MLENLAILVAAGRQDRPVALFPKGLVRIKVPELT